MDPSPRCFPAKIPKLLTGLRLNDAPYAYSFCNLDLQPLTPTVECTGLLSVFGPRRASKYLKVPELTGHRNKICEPGERITKQY
jgi:hypothetical protein